MINRARCIIFWACLASTVLCLALPGLGEGMEAGLCQHRVLPFLPTEETMITFAYGTPTPTDMETDHRPLLDENQNPVEGLEDFAFYPKGDGIVPGGNLMRDPFFPGVVNLHLNRLCLPEHNHRNRFPEDFEPSGIAKGQWSREEAVRQAQEAASALSLGEYRLNAVWAGGALGEAFPSLASKFSPTYTVRFTQTLDDLPIYWADSATTISQNVFIHLQPNMVTVSLCDGGVYRVEARWSMFEALGERQSPVGEDVAQRELARYGTEAEALELCYLLLPGNDTENVAIPAYRYQDRFVDALTGIRLQ